MINSSKFLAPSYQAWPTGLLALNIFVFAAVMYSVQGSAPFFVSWLKTHWQSLLILYGGMVLMLIIGNLVNGRLKDVLVFWDWSESLPVTRVFTRYLPKKRGTDPEAPGSSTDQLPSNPAEQEALWLQIYSKHKTDPAVSDACNDFLLTRELTWLSFVVLIFFGIGALITGKYTVQTLAYPAFLLAQYIATSTVARSNGLRFVGNVLAVAQAHKITGQNYSSAEFAHR